VKDVRTKGSQYQQGSIRKVRKAKGYAWEVRFSEWFNGKRFQRTMTFQGNAYPKESDVRKAIELTVSQINSGTARERADAKFGAIITLYRRKFLPSERRLLELKKKLRKVFRENVALVDAFTVAREDEIDEINLMLKAAATAENINLLAQRLAVPQAPDLQFSTRQHHEYLLDHYIEPKFSKVPLREMKVLLVEDWLESLLGEKGRPLAGTTKASIRTLLSNCFNLAAKHEYISAFHQNPMYLVKIKGVSERQKEIQQITVNQFKVLLADLPEVLKMLVVVDAALGLRISELLALKWEDLDIENKTIFIRRKFTRGRIGKTKTPALCAKLPVADILLEMLLEWKKKIGESEWIFPSTRTGGPRSGSMLLQKGLKPIAAKHGIPGLTWHALRHACRAWLSSGGANITTQKGLLRHADESTTSDVYGYPMTEDMRKAHDNLVSQLIQR
jgi:integrase